MPSLFTLKDPSKGRNQEGGEKERHHCIIDSNSRIKRAGRWKHEQRLKRSSYHWYQEYQYASQTRNLKQTYSRTTIWICEKETSERPPLVPAATRIGVSLPYPCVTMPAIADIINDLKERSAHHLSSFTLLFFAAYCPLCGCFVSLFVWQSRRAPVLASFSLHLLLVPFLLPSHSSSHLLWVMPPLSSHPKFSFAFFTFFLILSHYFQAFSVLWLILVVVFFVGFGNLGTFYLSSS